MTIDFPSFLLSSSVLSYGWFDSWAEDRPWTEVLGVGNKMVLAPQSALQREGKWEAELGGSGDGLVAATRPTGIRGSPFFFLQLFLYIM